MVVKNLKEKTFRKYVNGVSINTNRLRNDNDPGVLLRHVYDNLYPSLDGPSIAAAVLIVAKTVFTINTNRNQCLHHRNYSTVVTR